MDLKDQPFDISEAGFGSEHLATDIYIREEIITGIQVCMSISQLRKDDFYLPILRLLDALGKRPASGV